LLLSVSKMKLQIFDQEKKKLNEKELPSQFNEEYRPDLIKRAIHALQSAARQAYGANPGAGMRHSSTLSKRRRKYRGCYGFGISRVNRKILSRRGTRMFWVGTFSPQTRGGRRSHAPKAEKSFEQNINKKENRKAIRSAIAATVNKSLVESRGHKVPEDYPFILDSSFEQQNKTKSVKNTLKQLGFSDELQRSLIKKVRAGIGKVRGRKYQRKKGLLIVVGDDCPLLQSAKNIAGLDVVKVNSLNAELLAPGTMPGRIAIWTEKAIESLEKNKLFN
jgi:large subunit ribosomal protein L4e